MQEQSEAERRATWPCLMLLLGERSEATEPYNKYDKIRPQSIRSVQFDQKVRPLLFRPEKFDIFTATGERKKICEQTDARYAELMS